MAKEKSKKKLGMTTLIFIGLFLGAGILSSDGLKSIIEDSISSSDFDSTYISP